MATIQDFDRAYVEARRDRDGSVARAERIYHARQRASAHLGDRIVADLRLDTIHGETLTLSDVATLRRLYEGTDR